MQIETKQFCDCVAQKAFNEYKDFYLTTDENLGEPMDILVAVVERVCAEEDLRNSDLQEYVQIKCRMLYAQYEMHLYGIGVDIISSIEKIYQTSKDKVNDLVKLEDKMVRKFPQGSVYITNLINNVTKPDFQEALDCMAAIGEEFCEDDA